MNRADVIRNMASCLAVEEPIHLYCGNDRYLFYYSKPYAVNQYGVEAIKIKVVDRFNRNNFVLMSAPVDMLQASNGISMYEISKIQDFVQRNLFIIYELAKEVNS